MINSKEIEVYKQILTDLNDGKKLSYNELEELLLINFGLKITKQELISMDSPTFLDESIDLKIQYRNIN